MNSDQGKRKSLKDILLQEGVVSPADMNEVLREQEKTQASLLDAIFAHGQFDELKLERVLRNYFDYTTVNPGFLAIDPEIIALLSKPLAEKYLALPLSRHEKTLTIAFANPMNLRAVDEISAVTGLRIKPVVAKPSVIQESIQKYYDAAAKQPGASDSPDDDAAIDDLVKMVELEQESEGDQVDSAELMKVALDTPVVKLVNMLLVEGIRRHASDIFIEPWERFVRVRARVDGLLEEIIRPQKSLAQAIVSRIKIMSSLDISEHRIPQDGRFKVKVANRAVDMRVSILPSSFGEKVCLRILDTSAQSHDLGKLGFSEEELQVIRDSSRKPHGMILVTGPTGSGKTTTLYSVLEYLDNPEINITTVEEPVEYQLPGINQVNVREQVGLTFPAALRSILRQDPDTILIGEIRDNETLDIAVKAALTGHLVLSTLHTNDAASSITRMMNMGLEPFLIASTVLMISAQRLVRRLCDKCKVPDEVERKLLERAGVEVAAGGGKVTFYKGKGCNSCRYTGYKGRSVITEILPVTESVRELIMKGATADQIKNYARKNEGMTSLRECAVRKALEGETSLEEVFRVTTSDHCEDEGVENGKKEAA